MTNIEHHAKIPVETGLERLFRQKKELFQNKRIGLLANPSSTDRLLRHALSLLMQETGARLGCLFAPEHGFSSSAQDMIDIPDALDRSSHIPIYSLYGKTVDSLRPNPQQLAGLDLVIMDIQDVGSRYYTFVWTMAMMLEACSAHGIATVILDRPNPLGGTQVEGPSLGGDFRSFVGYYDVVVRHGLTVAELLNMFCREMAIGAHCHLVTMEGWQRHFDFDACGLPWILPSPNMPTVDTAFVYPGSCLLEGTNISEGRGTTKPFEIIGAPWIQSELLADAMNSLGLAGVRYRPLEFLPTFHKYCQRACQGVQLHVTDRSVFRPFRCGLALLHTIHRLWPTEFAWREKPYEFVCDKPAIDLLAGGSWLRRDVDANRSLSEMFAELSEQELAFDVRRRPYLLYA